MSAENQVRIRPPDHIDDTNKTKPPPQIHPRQIYGLMAYYMALLIGAIVLMIYLVSSENPTSKDEKTRLLVSMGFLASGAVVGSILYQIRILFKFYIKEKKGSFDPRWLSKYITAPLEAVGLALAVMSLVQSSGVILGGHSVDVGTEKPFAAFGFGALVGFGIREVVGWVGSLTKAMFPTEEKKEKDRASGEHQSSNSRQSRSSTARKINSR